MDRLPVKLTVLAMTLVGVGALAPVAAQTPAPHKKPAPAARQEPLSKAKEKAKVREGAYLKKDLVVERKVDLRSGYEKARDAEMMTHYQRLAALDWIEQLATKAKDTRLLERVEAVRRKEARRYRDVMTGLLEQSRARDVVGFQ